ncbi:hypothetical protein ACF0H5_014959 [Mactra antiquata]
MAVMCIYLAMLLALFAFEINSSKVNERRRELHYLKKRSADDTPEYLLDKYRETASSDLIKGSNSFDKLPMSRLSMSCRSKGYSKIMADFPQAEIRWKHNGDNLVLQPSRMVTTLDSLTIQNLIPTDSGIYHCQLGLTDTFNLVVKIYSVVVGNLTMYVNEGENLDIDCHAKEIGVVFNKAIRVWVNPTGVRVIQKPASDISNDVINSASKKSSGVWTCMVENPELKQTWKTARIKVVLEPPLSDWDKTKQYAKNNKFVVIILLFLATFIIVLIIDGFTKIFEWKEKKFNKELDDVKKILGLDDAGRGPEGIPLLLEAAEDTELTSSSSDCEI